MQSEDPVPSPRSRRLARRIVRIRAGAESASRAFDRLADRLIAFLVSVAMAVGHVTLELWRPVRRRIGPHARGLVRFANVVQEGASAVYAEIVRIGLAISGNQVFQGFVGLVASLWRWLDARQRSGVARVRRLVGGYFIVFLDPEVPVTKRTLHAAKGIAVTGGLTTAALVIFMVMLIPFTPGRETIRNLGNEHPATVLDANGEVITRYRRVNREWVRLEQVSPHFLNGLLTTEDRRFFEHSGLDLRRMIGAGIKTVAGDLQGGSTLTQQLARNLFPQEIGRRISLQRKLREIVTALKIEAIYSKDEILESYINTVPFLYNAVGVEMAARTYFGKSAADLDALESATLVAMLKGTHSYNPVRNPERALERRNVVLREMAMYGSLDSLKLAELVDDPLEVSFKPQPIRNSRAPHFSEYVRRWVVSWADRNGYSIYTDSLVVYTTLDLRVQELADEALRLHADDLQAVADVEWSEPSRRMYSSTASQYRRIRDQKAPFAYFWSTRDSLVNTYVRASDEYGLGVASGLDGEALLDSLRSDDVFMDSLRAERTRLEASFIAVEPRSGYVRAWVGSRNFEKDQFDHVASARRQPGSTFKPILYAAALERGFSSHDIFTDRHVAIRYDGQVWSPRNAGRITGQSMTLREGLAHSVNTISAQLIERVGADRVAEMAERLGITSPLDRVPSLALGTSAVTLKELVTAYSTIAAGGVRPDLVTVTRIEDRDGNVLYEASPERKDVVPEHVTAELIEMMRGAVNEGTARRIRYTHGIQTDVAGKTGTTQEGADGWFVLLHPDLVVGAWVGFNDQRITFRTDYWGQGSHTALPIVGEFFRSAFRHDGLNLEYRPPRQEVRYTRIRHGGVFGWVGDTFSKPKYETVVVEGERPRSNLGRRLPSEEVGSRATHASLAPGN